MRRSSPPFRARMREDDTLEPGMVREMRTATKGGSLPAPWCP
jgi:hypothetical protein